MKKRILTFLLAAAMLLGFLPGLPSAQAASGPVSGDLMTENLTTDMLGVQFDTSFNMVFVEGGTFTLGWEASDASLRPENVDPVRNVTVSDFYIGETEVTVSMWNAVMGLGAPGADANRPKEGVSFYQIQEFLDRLYVLTGKTYRLLTEAEWEFAAKGGNPGREGNAEYPGNNHKYLFAGSNVHDEVVANTAGVQNVKTKKPNILGIYDLCGNAEEWVYNSFDAALVGGVDPIGPSGPFHQQKTRRGGTYGGTSPDSTRTLSARQIRSIDGGAGMGFRIGLSGDMKSVPAGMVRPREVVHPSIDERNLPVTYRDQRLVTGDEKIWFGNFYNSIFVTMKLWDTGEMVIQSPGFDDRVGQWYTVSNLGIVFVQNAFEEDEVRITLPYMFMTEELISVINDVSFMGDGLPMCRFERTADTGDIAKPTGLTLYDPEVLAAASEHDHTSYDLSNITDDMKGHDTRLLDGDGYGWWLSASVGMHQYRQDITDSIFRFVVYSPAFNFGRNGADVGYGANFLAQGAWYTVNDMLLVVGSGATVQHYLYTVTDEVSAYITGTSSRTARQLMEISYQSYEKGDMRYLERHANADVRGYSGEIPNGFVLSQGGSTFLAAPEEEETLCPGGCGEVISHCKCPTMCPVCNEHIDDCYCDDAPERVAAAARAARAALAAYKPENSATQDHLDAIARVAVGSHNIERTWSDFNKVSATRDSAGSISGTLTLSLAGNTETVSVSLSIDKLPQASGEGITIVPDATVDGKQLTMTVTDIQDQFTNFDLGGLYGMPGAFGYIYALWFDSEGTFTFDRDVTLTKTYMDSSFNTTGTDTVTVKAGETVRVADGLYSETMGETVRWSEFAFSLDGSGSILIVDSAEPGNYAFTPADTPLSEFPGYVGDAASAPKAAPECMVSNQPVALDGKVVEIAHYNVDGNNYFKLRDLACILNGSAWQYNVGYDSASRTVTITTAQGYTPLDTDMVVGEDASDTCVLSNQQVLVNGKAVSILAYNIGGDNYVQLRDLAAYVGYGVDYDSSTRTVLITTK